MADVPGILIFGGFHTQGGSKPASIISAAGAYSTLDVGSLDLHRVYPDNGTTGAPQAVALDWFPWFDGSAGGVDATDIFTVASSTADTVTVTPDPGWSINEWDGFLVTTTNATGLGFKNRQFEVESNTSDTVTIVAAAWTSNPTAATEGIFFNEGRWRDYSAHAGWLAFTELAVAISTRGGSSWESAGQGIGPDAGLIREVLDNVYTVPPYFQVAKWAVTATTVAGYSDSPGSARAAFLVEKARWDAAWTVLANGDTLDWQWVVMDLSTNDVEDWEPISGNPGNTLLYQDSVTEAIAWLRSAAVFDNASLKILLVNHDADIEGVTSPGGTVFANAVHRAVELADDNVRVVNLDGRGLLTRGDAGLLQPSENRNYYEAPVYWNDYPKLVREGMEILLLGAVPNYDGAVPTYIMIGDSIFVGPITAAYLAQLDHQEITDGPRDPKQGIWNDSSKTVEPYDAIDNSNTSGSTTAVAAEECSLLVELQRLHPVTGCIIIKRASNSSTLIADVATYTGAGVSGGRWSTTQAAEHYAALGPLVDSATSYINTTLGKQVDLKAIIVSLGANDGTVTGGGALFAADLPLFVSALRADFSTRTSGSETPILWRRPQLGINSADEDETIAIRAALAAQAASDARFVDVDFDNIARDASGNIHETPSGSVNGGRLIAAALETVSI